MTGDHSQSEIVVVVVKVSNKSMVLAVLLQAMTTVGHAQIVTDGTVGPALTIGGPDYAITADLGRRAGGNLFHSFGRFDVDTGESATFSGPADIRNVIARVTGGTASTIDGLLRSTIPAANLYLFNPAGLAFGPNASLDIDGSFHAATADHIDFADGSRYSASDPSGGSFTTAAPAAFGFLGANPATLTVTGSTLAPPGGQRLELVGGRLDITDATLGLRTTQIDLKAGVGGDIHVTGGNIVARGVGAESITISGSQVVINGARIQSVNDGANDQPSPGLIIESSTLEVGDNSFIRTLSQAAGVIGPFVINADKVEVSGGASIFADQLGAGVTQGIRLTADDVKVSDQAAIATRVDGNGDGGPLRVDVGSLEVANSGAIFTIAFGDGDAGSIVLDVGRLRVVDGANIQSVTNSAGRSGDLNIRARESIEVSQDVIEGTEIRIISRSSGATGSMLIETPILTLNNGVLGSQGTSSGAIGDTIIVADMVQLIGGSIITEASSDSEISTGKMRIEAKKFVARASDILQPSLNSSNDGTGRPGVIELVVSDIDMENIIVSSEAASGDGADIRFVADTIRLAENFEIDARTVDGVSGKIEFLANDEISIAGNNNFLNFVSTISNSVGELSAPSGAGGIQLRAPSISVSATSISSDGDFGADAGNIVLEGDHIAIGDGTNLRSSVFGFSESQDDGNAGNVHIIGRRTVSIENLAEFTSITSEANSFGRAGEILIAAPDVIIDGPFITNSVRENATANSIVLRGERIQLRNSFINSQAEGFETGGTIRIEASDTFLMENGRITTGADDLLIRDGDKLPGGGGDVFLSAGQAVIDGGSIASGTAGAGAGGTVTLAVNDLVIRSFGSVSSETTSAGAAGDVTVMAAGTITLENGKIEAGFSELFDPLKTGNAGKVTATANVLNLFGGRIVTNVVDGTGGNIEINAGTMTVSSTVSSVNADTSGSGDGGTVRITVNDLTATGGGLISTSTSGPGAAGDTVIQATASVLVTGGQAFGTKLSTVASESIGAGPAGRVEITTSLLTVADRGVITTSAFEDGDGGSLTITASKIAVTNGGRIASSSAGNDLAGDILIAATNSLRLQGGEITAEAVRGDGGNIIIRVGRLVELNKGGITTTVAGGVGDGGNIDIDPIFLVLIDSRIVANAFAGDGGSIQLTADTILVDDDSVISASSTLGIDGTVSVEAVDTDVTASLKILNTDFLNAAALLSQQCALRGGQTVATLTATGRGALPSNPNVFQAADYFVAASAAPSAGRLADGVIVAAINWPAVIPLRCTM